MKVKIIADECTGCGVCEAMCPEVFKMDGEVPVVKIEPVPEEYREDVKNAAEDCSNGAIQVSE